MDQPLVSRVALRMALTRLIEIVGGTTVEEVRVSVTDLGNEKMYAALVPLERRLEVHHYVAERTEVPMPLDGYTLLLNGDQALTVINLAYRATPQDASRPQIALEQASSDPGLAQECPQGAE